MALITDIVDLAVLTGAAREIPNPTTYVLDGALPNVEIQDVEYAVRASVITRGVAQYRNYDAETPIGRRSATTTLSRGLLPPLGQKLVIGEYERVLLQRAQGAQTGALVQQVYDDTRSNVLAIRARLEQARGQVLTTGKFTLTDENGLTLEADFGVPSDHMNVAPAGALWTDPAADFFGDMETWVAKYRLDNDGEAPGQVWTSLRVVNLIRKNVQVIKAVFGPLATSGRVTAAQVNEVLVEQGLPQINVVETLIGGARTMADDKVVLTPADPATLGRTIFGITADALELVNSNAVDLSLRDAPGITALTLKDGDPMRVWSKSVAAAMPVIDNPKRLFVADVA